MKFIKVKGHADHPENNRCDYLARAAIKEYQRLNSENNRCDYLARAAIKEYQRLNSEEKKEDK